ncbi:hypothetical protein LIN78_00515 [Leeia sp. TBRC 13508]|uniref:Ribbon-helix-helix protein CopG domain-containing protein n=1 Tax=Leeia speluncae TaxID=2884804 RepID=A0ABS8D244_9NEIS|nr:hypothetical protein [Leeia speluncae]MCB6182038.1 hypothetical protein [Leeia speluncae]
MSRLTINLSHEIDQKLTDIANRNGITKAEAMRKAFALLAVADSLKQRGNSLGIVRENGNEHRLEVVGSVIGL